MPAGHYVERSESVNLPSFPVEEVSTWIERYREMDEQDWEDECRRWIQKRARESKKK